MILLSAHLDRVRSQFPLAFHDGVHTGLLDNWLGVTLVYLALYDTPSLLRWERQGRVRVWHNQGEEFGDLVEPPRLTKHDIAVVVDVASGPQYKTLDVGIENVAHVPKKVVHAVKTALDWERIRARWKPWSGDPDEADEAWSWRALGIPTLTLIVPIEGPWHRSDSTIGSDRVSVARHALQRLVCCLGDWY